MKWYKYDIREMCEKEYQKWYSLMDDKKKKRVDSFRFSDDKKRTVAGEMLARKAISEVCSVAPESIIFDVAENGKPFAKGLNVHFNISHSENMVVCAVDDEQVGTDIEKIRSVNLNVAKRYFYDDEIQYVFGHIPANEEFFAKTDDYEVLKRFFEVWTRKEAYVKFTGKGISGINEKIDAVHRKFEFDEYVITIVTQK